MTFREGLKILGACRAKATGSITICANIRLDVAFLWFWSGLRLQRTSEGMAAQVRTVSKLRWENEMKTTMTFLAVSLALATPLHALDLTQWGTSGDWVILQDPNHGNDCLAQATFSDGSMLRMGFQDKGKKGFLATFNPAWKEFQPDRTYPVSYMLDTDRFEGEARGVEAGGMPGAQVYYENVDFLVDLAKRETLTFMSNGAEVVKIGLKGSADALTQVLACQQAKG